MFKFISITKKSNCFNFPIRIILKKINTFLFLVFVFIFLTSNILFVYADIEDEDTNLENNSNDILSEVSTTVSTEPQISSKYAIAIERSTGTILFEHSAFEQTAMASTTKILTAILAIEFGNLDDIVTISKNAALTGGSRLGLEENMQITLYDLLYGLMLRSRK
jgi:D-alanyl-D-alanine carboxypeptidase